MLICSGSNTEKFQSTMRQTIKTEVLKAKDLIETIKKKKWKTMTVFFKLRNTEQ